MDNYSKRMERIIERIADEVDELDNYKGKWRNLNFDKNGNTYRGMQTHDSESAALRAHEELIDWLNENPWCSRGNLRVIETLDGEILPWDYSHAIQIPVGEE